MKPLKALTVDFELIEHSMRDLSREFHDYYLDKSNGKVVVLSRGVIRYLVDCNRNTLLPDWESRLIPIAREIVIKGSPIYIRIPEAFGRPEHTWMNQFADDIRGEKLRHRLKTTLRGRDSCPRFKEILKEHPDDVRRYRQHAVNRWKQKIESWLEPHGILAVERRPKKK